MPANTKPRSFRITVTQNALLNKPSVKYKASAIVRVLLNLYLNARLKMDEVETAIAEEVRAADLRNSDKSKREGA